MIDEYVGNMPAGHAKVRMEEVEKHLDDTYFAWVGGTGADAVFYYRIQSPVILIEFDHQTPVALPGPKVPGRIHVHTVVRTPNGNDYGKDLLRQHYAAHQHDPVARPRTIDAISRLNVMTHRLGVVATSRTISGRTGRRS